MNEAYKTLWYVASTWGFLQGLYDMIHLRHFAALAAVFSLGAHAQAQCPDYSSFSQVPQGNASSGPLKLPFMRPSPECRTFTSPAVEVGSIFMAQASYLMLYPQSKQVITDMKARLKDPDLARLFENTFPNTLGMIRHFCHHRRH